eukprot:COSAG01_NODE_71886_length_254_cov_1.083871_1_plen_31_part_01
MATRPPRSDFFLLEGPVVIFSVALTLLHSAA